MILKHESELQQRGLQIFADGYISGSDLVCNVAKVA